MNKMPAAALEIPKESAEELYENAPCGYISSLPDGLIVRVNQTFLDQMKFDAADVLEKRRVQDLMTIPGRVFYDTHFAPLLRMQGFIKEIACDIVRGDGEKAAVLINAVQINNDAGEPAVIRFTIFEAAERRRFESALIEAQRRAEHYESIIRSSSDAILSIRGDGRIRTWNPAAETIFECTAGEAIGKHISEIIEVEGHESPFDIAASKLSTGESLAGVAVCITRSTGTRKNISYRLSGHIQPPDELTAVSAILRDITEVLQASAARRQQEMLKKVVDHQEQERRRIARDLHDHIGQQITGISLALTNLSGKGGPLEPDLKALQEKVAQMDRDVSFLAFELRPQVLQTMDVGDAIEHFGSQWARNYGVDARFHCKKLDTRRLASDIETNLYRIAQEALNNIAKHAKARNVSILLDIGETETRMVIEDDGAGFKMGSKSAQPFTGAGHGAGLVGMRERSELIGGEFEIESAPGAGTSIFVRVPSRIAIPRTAAAAERRSNQPS